jgi:hypothetical protein
MTKHENIIIKNMHYTAIPSAIHSKCTKRKVLQFITICFIIHIIQKIKMCDCEHNTVLMISSKLLKRITGILGRKALTSTIDIKSVNFKF